MSGHSKWSTIKHAKGIADAKRGQMFTKFIKEISIAAKMGGGDINSNPRLRTAVLKARASSMPKDNIDRAIKKGIGGDDGKVFEELVYEGYAAGGVAVLVEVLTDNKNRAAADVRNFFTKNNGNLGVSGSVSRMVSSPLISRFGIIQRFNFYTKEELAEIIRRSAGILNVKVDDDAALLMADCSRGTPRVANRVLRRMRDFAQVQGSAVITKEIVVAGLRRLDIDKLGLEKYDREILLSIINNFAGGPVGADTLAISIGESMDTLEDYYEPYLIQCGLLQRTPRGRIVTEKAYQHLGLAPRKGNDDENQRLLF